MSTDLYGARVLAVAPDRLSVRMRVFVVYYEVESREALDLPGDPAFFLRLLWDCATEDRRREVPGDRPLAEIELDRLIDESWVAAHTGEYVRSADRVAERNAVLESADWERLRDFYYERHGGWLDEHRLVQADFVVRVTDPRWLAGVRPGRSWATTWYPSPGMQVRAEDGPYVPRFSEPVAVIVPFADRSGGGQYTCDLAFSDDGDLLAVAGQQGDVRVYDTGDWTERARFRTPHDLMGPRLMWVPGRHVVTARPVAAYEPQVAWDADADAAAEVPLELGFDRSRTGRYRVEYMEGPGVEFVSAPFTPDRTVLLGLDAEADAGDAPPAAGGVGFSADESRMFALCTEDEHARFSVLDPQTGRFLGAVDTSTTMVMGFAVSPDGAYLAIAEETAGLVAEPTIRRVADGGGLVLRARFGLLTGRIDWSPDGRLIAADLHHPGDRPSELRIFPVGAADEREEAPPQGDAATTTVSPRVISRVLAGERDPAPVLSGGGTDEAIEWLYRVAAGEDPSAGPQAAVALGVLGRAAGGPEPIVRGLVAEHTGDPGAARAIYESTTGPAGALAEVLLGRLLTDPGTEHAPRRAREILTAAQESTDPLTASYAGYLLGGSLIDSGESAAAEAVLRRACETALALRGSPHGLLPWIAVRLGELLIEGEAGLDEIGAVFAQAQPLCEIAAPSLAAVGQGVLDANPYAVRGALQCLRAWSDERHAHGCRLATRLGMRIVEDSDDPAGHPLADMLRDLDGVPESAAYALWLTARERQRSGDWDGALRAWGTAADTGLLPYARWAGSCQAVLLTVRGDAAGARHALRHGRDDRRIVEVADAFRKAKWDEDAMTAYLMAAEGDDPLTVGRASLGIGHIHSEDGRLEEAAAAYRRAHRLAGGSAATNAAFHLSTVLTELGDADGAAEAARDAHQRAVAAGDPARGRARTARRLGDKLRARRDWAGARDAYRAAVEAWREERDEEYPFDARWALLYLAQVHGHLEEYDASERILRKLLKIFAQPEDAEQREIIVIAALTMALHAKVRRDLAKARPWFQQVIDSGDTNHIPTAVAHLAELHYWLGDRAEAARHYERTLALSENPEFVAEAAYRLGEHLAETGDHVRAGELMKRTLASRFTGFDDDARQLLARLRTP